MPRPLMSNQPRLNFLLLPFPRNSPLYVKEISCIKAGTYHVCSMDVLLSQHVSQLPLTSKHHLLDEPVIQLSSNRTKKIDVSAGISLLRRLTVSIAYLESCSRTPTVLKIESITNRFDADVITHLSKSLITATYCKADFGVVPKSNIFYTLTALFCVNLPGTLVSLVT